MKPKLLAINLPNLDLSFFTKRGLEFDVKHINLDLNVPLKWLYNFNGQEFHTPDLHETLNAKFSKYEQTFILYGYKNNDPKNTTGGYAFFNPLKSGSFWASVRIDGNEYKYAQHELMHLICNYINTEQLISKFDITRRVSPIFESNLQHAIIVEFDGKEFANHHVNFIKQLPLMISDSGEIGIMEYDIFRFTINQLSSLENRLVHADNPWYINNLTNQ
jgi:hypothetical protein